MQSPSTVSEAVAFLVERGYQEDFPLGIDDVQATALSVTASFEDVSVDYSFRFDGPSDPSDEAIVLGLCRRDGQRGVVVSAFGPDADRQHTLLMVALAARGEH